MTNILYRFIRNLDIIDIVALMLLAIILSYVMILSGVKYENFIIINNFFDDCISHWRSIIRFIS